MLGRVKGGTVSTPMTSCFDSLLHKPKVCLPLMEDLHAWGGVGEQEILQNMKLA